MSQVVIATGTCMCSMGTAPAPVKVTNNTKVLADGKPVATTADCQGIANVGPFGMCTSLANPAVASATAAALGVLTPQPCTPVVAGTWVPTKPKVLIGGKPCLSADSSAVCSYAGSISLTFAGQVKTVAN